MDPNSHLMMSSFLWCDFPPPPPDAFAPENFVLPPPPPPPLPEVLNGELNAMVVTQPESGTARSQCEPHLDSLQPVTQNGTCTNSTTIPSTVTSLNPSPLSLGVTSERPKGTRPGATGACRRPAVPQRAPSTRLSSVPVTCNGLEEFRPRSVAVDSLVLLQESRGSAESLPNPHIKSPSSDRVSPVSLRQTNLEEEEEEESTIDQTVPPVSDIIRRFDRRDQTVAVGAPCRPGQTQSRPTSQITREDSRMNPVPSSSSDAIVVTPERNFSTPTDSFGQTTSVHPPAPGENCPNSGPSSAVQQSARGFMLSRSTSVDTTRPTVPMPPVSPLARKPSSPTPFPTSCGTTGQFGKLSVVPDPVLPARVRSTQPGMFLLTFRVPLAAHKSTGAIIQGAASSNPRVVRSL
ncbi:unnamed protein product [Echinostoma caproni]|uniref:NYAP_N domain-containing protein n=1 Tax=Echinostoma caproni TaxID=27848 RepID=A0A183ADI0_9TREM|nr:unnamed protein product [Echinostoma caproni]